MCIAILKTKKGKISDEELTNSFNRNSDGAGIAYTINNTLVIDKGIFTAKDLIDRVRKAEKVCDGNMLIHCRIGTSGLKDKTNTHPFLVNNKVALIHNGILDVVVPKGSKINDTQIFINKYLKDFKTKDLMHNKTLQELIKKAIGSGNKFVLLDNTGYYKIINEEKGHWKDNVWYSNESYKKIETYYQCHLSDFGSRYRWWDDEDYDDYEESYTFNSKNYSKEYDYSELDDDTKELLLTDIYNMSAKTLKEIGIDPVYESKTKKIISIDEAEKINNDTCYWLEDVDKEIYEQYMMMYEYMEKEEEMAS